MKKGIYVSGSTTADDAQFTDLLALIDRTELNTDAALWPKQVPERPQLVCLLPARNAAADLPGYFESAARFCDAIIALDDGSTDNTREILAAHPLVKILLTNPRHDDYRGWDDSANRNRLLAAAHALQPYWIMSLDADERLDPDDAAALRQFLSQDALPGCAFGFRVVPMQYDLEHYEPKYLWVYRLFAFEPGQVFPSRRLHFVPIPTSIPRRAWLKTTIRIQHLGGMTEERRHARFEKYRQADPNRQYQADYSNLLHTPPPNLPRWQPRPPNLPVLLGAANAWYAANGGAARTEARDAPALSVIVISRNDEERIAQCIAAIVTQDCPEPFEVIVVTSGTDRTAAVVRKQFPDVTVVELAQPALPGAARNAGLRQARGTYVTFPGSHVVLAPGSLAARLRAHRQGYAMVAGAALNGTTTSSGWASYFLDHAEGLPSHQARVVKGAPGACSYMRNALEELGGFPEDLRAGEDTFVNLALVRRGYVAYRDPQILFTHYSPCRTPWRLVRHHFVRGRGLGRILLHNADGQGALLTRRFLERRLHGYLPQRLRRTTTGVMRGGDEYRSIYAQVFPLVVAGATAAWLGMWYEILRPARGKWQRLLGRF